MSLIDALMGDKGLVVKFKADLTGLQSGIAQAKTDLTGWRDETNKSTGDMAKWGAAIGAEVAPILAVGYALKSTIDTAEKYQEEIQQFSYVTGMNTDQAQRWRAATIATDTDFGAFTFTMQNLNARITANTADGEALRKTLTEMGVAVKDTNGNYVDSDTLMRSLLQSFDRMPSAQAKDAAAKEILGRSWANLAEMINESGDALDAYDKAAPGISQADLDRVDEFKIRWAKLSDQLTVTTAVIGVDMIKALDRAKNGWDMLGSAASLNIKGVQDALRESSRLGAEDTTAARQKWESEHLDILSKSGEGINWDLYNGQVANAKTANAKTDPFAGLSSQDAEIKNLKDYTIPGLEARLKDLQTSGTAAYSEIAAASLDLINAKERLVDLTTKETDAQRELRTATEDLADAKSELQDIEKDYNRELLMTNVRDTAAVRRLTITHLADVEDQTKAISAAETKVAAVANTGATGTATPGDTTVTINLDSSKIYEKTLAQSNRSMGVDINL